MLYLRNPKLLEMFFQHDNLDDYIDLMECDLRDRYLEMQSEKIEVCVIHCPRIL